MSLTPWKKLDNTSLSLIRKILMNLSSARYKISDIKQHRWFVTNFTKGKRYRFRSIIFFFFYNIRNTTHSILNVFAHYTRD